MNTNFVSKGIALFGFSLLALCATPEASAQIATEPNALLNTESLHIKFFIGHDSKAKFPNLIVVFLVDIFQIFLQPTPSFSALFPLGYQPH